MKLSRVALSAVASIVVATPALVGVTTPAQADPTQDIALPAGPDGMKVYSVSFGDGVVYASWGDKGFGLSSTYVAPDDGTGSWQQLHVPSSGVAISHVQGADDGVFVEYDSAASCTRVVTATSDWLVPGCGSGVNVGHGGDLVAVQRYDMTVGHDVYDVYDAVDGPDGGVLDTTSSPPALAGTWVWTASQGLLSGKDTTSDEHKSVALGDSCRRATVLEVVGYAATVRCVDDSATRTVLADLVGTSRPVDVSGGLRMLGNGFLYAGTSGVIHATDLSASLAAQDVASYFPRGSGWYPGPGWVGTGPADYSGATTGSPRIAYLADAETVRVATLSGLGTPPTGATDTTPPEITSTAGSPGAVRRGADGETPISFSWSGEDDEAAAPTYDVQVKDSVHTDDAPGWQPLPGAQGTFDTSAVYEEENASRVCLRVRAVDRVGNRSPWSDPRCTSVDVARPWMRDGRHDTPPWWQQILSSVGRQQVTYRFHGTDDTTGVTSYDVQERGEAGTWHTAAGDLTRGRYPSSVRAGHEKCFRARAHDFVGRRSAYGDRRCFISPLDDRAFASHGGRRVELHSALGGSVTKLRWHGPSITRAHVSGRKLAVLEKSDLGGCPRVWWGGDPVMSRSCSGGRERRDGFTWYVVELHRVHHGTLRVAAPFGANWTEVDAVAVAR